MAFQNLLLAKPELLQPRGLLKARLAALGSQMVQLKRLQVLVAQERLHLYLVLDQLVG
jgi:hypothetical protein